MQRGWLLGLLCGLSFVAQAHDSWLAWQPDPAQPRLTQLRLSTGDGFPIPGSGHRTDRLLLAEHLKGELRLPLLLGEPQPGWLPLSAARGDAEALLARISTRPQRIELDPDQVAAYLRELGGDPQAAQRYAAQRRWREQFSKHAKTLVRHQPGPALAEATQAQGSAFELVPSLDPTTLAPGSPFEVCAMSLQRPVPRAYIGLVEADGSATWTWSNADGCVELAPRSASGYLIRSVLLRPAEEAELEWESHFASLTVYRPFPSSDQ